MNTSFAAQRRKLLIALEASALSVLMIIMLSCGGSSPATVPAPPAAPTANNAMIVSLDALLISCAVTAPDVSPAVSAWLVPGCANAVNGVLSAVTANGTLAQIEAAVTALQTFVSAAPAGALSQHDQQIIASITGGLRAFITIYQATSGVTDRMRIGSCDERIVFGSGPPISPCTLTTSYMGISDAPQSR